jgi:hypothetical protein
MLGLTWTEILLTSILEFDMTTLFQNMRLCSMSNSSSFDQEQPPLLLCVMTADGKRKFEQAREYCAKDERESSVRQLYKQHELSYPNCFVSIGVFLSVPNHGNKIFSYAMAGGLADGYAAELVKTLVVPDIEVWAPQDIQDLGKAGGKLEVAVSTMSAQEKLEALCTVAGLTAGPTHYAEARLHRPLRLEEVVEFHSLSAFQ